MAEFTEAGVCHGFALWIDWVMDSTNDVVMTTGPGCPTKQSLTILLMNMH
ncbi:hypothetical protein Hanom_Chr01g00009101 [Helianthus anomalus]